MAVTVKGDPDGGVSEPLLYLFGMGALGDQKSRTGVAQVMEPIQRHVPLATVRVLTKTEFSVYPEETSAGR